LRTAHRPGQTENVTRCERELGACWTNRCHCQRGVNLAGSQSHKFGDLKQVGALIVANHSIGKRNRAPTDILSGVGSSKTSLVEAIGRNSNLADIPRKWSDLRERVKASPLDHL